MASVLGGLAAFVWGNVSWMVLPWHNWTIKNMTIEGEAAVSEALRAHAGADGVYTLPGYPMEEGGDAWDAWMERHRQGPIVLIQYRAEGAEPMTPAVMVTGLLISVIASAVIAVLLSMAGGSLNTWPRRMGFLALLGAFAALVSHGALWNWMYEPWDYALVMGLDIVATYLIAGSVVAAMVKPRGPDAEPA